MKKLGFVDYYIGEWHADNYPAWIDECNRTNGTDFKVSYVWAELDKSPRNGQTTEEWCAAHGAEKCDTIEELCRKSDYIVVLAPSDPDKHLGYAEQVLKCGKNTYIDKTFAPDLATAEKIYAIAKKYGTKIFSSSALRYGSELNDFAAPRNVVTTGGGGNLPEYIVHQTEMVVRLLGTGAKRVRVDKELDRSVCRVEYGDGRAATMIYAPCLPFTVTSAGESGKSEYRAINSPYFVSLIADILRFFETGEPSFPAEETIEVMRVREGVLAAADEPGKEIALRR